MQIPPISRDNSSFGVKFHRNKNFLEVVSYAKSKNKLQELDYALYKLLQVGDGDILIIHGKTGDSKVYSSFNLGKNSVQNSTYAVSQPAEASYKAILELIDSKNSKLAKLLGKKPKLYATSDEIIEKYSVYKVVL